MNSIKGIIFDYGGTLDTDGVHWFHILRRVYARHSPQVTEKQLREAYVYAERYLATHRIIEPEDDFLAMLHKKVRIQLSELKIENESLGTSIALTCNEMVRTHMIQTRKILDTLAARFPMVLVSNFYGNIHTVLRSYRLDGYFHEVVESAVAGVRKPDPQIFTLGIEALGLRPREIVVVGDSYGKDIVPAHSLGCHTVWIKGQGWENKEESTDTSCADAIITALPQLLDLPLLI